MRGHAKYQCQDCGDTFVCARDLSDHIEDEHFSPEPDDLSADPEALDILLSGDPT